MTALRLNTIAPAPGTHKPKKRKGRGMGSGLGKTCGRGHKGQTSRSGGSIPRGFEGGQMPMQRRLPKFGFCSRRSLTHEKIRLCDLNQITGDVVDMISLRAAGLINHHIKSVKIYLSGALKKSLAIRGLPVSAGARKAIEAQGGKVEE